MPAGYSSTSSDCFDNDATIVGCVVSPLGTYLGTSSYALLDSYTIDPGPQRAPLGGATQLHDRIYTPSGSYFLAVFQYTADCSTTITQATKCGLGCFSATANSNGYYARKWHSATCGSCPASATLKISSPSNGYFPAVRVVTTGANAGDSGCSLMSSGCSTNTLGTSAYYKLIDGDATQFCFLKLFNSGGTYQFGASLASNDPNRRLLQVLQGAPRGGGNASFADAPRPRRASGGGAATREEVLPFAAALWAALGARDVAGGAPGCPAGGLPDPGSGGACVLVRAPQCAAGGLLGSNGLCALRVAPAWGVGSPFAACPRGEGDALVLNVSEAAAGAAAAAAARGGGGGGGSPAALQCRAAAVPAAAGGATATDALWLVGGASAGVSAAVFASLCGVALLLLRRRKAAARKPVRARAAPATTARRGACEKAVLSPLRQGRRTDSKRGGGRRYVL
jgi:hypothetical protein